MMLNTNVCVAEQSNCATDGLCVSLNVTEDGCIGGAEVRRLAESRPQGALTRVAPSELPARNPIVVTRVGQRRPHALAAVCCAVWLAGCGATLNKPDGLSAVDGSGFAGPVVAKDVGSLDGKPNATPTIAPSAANKAANPKSTSTDFSSAVASDAKAYKIGAQDVLEVSVFKVPDLTRSVQVADSGSINLPLVGEIPAAGKTAQDVERDLTKRLGAKYLHNPQVTVFVKEFNSQRITVQGAVKKPGVFPLRGHTSLLQSIALAGGIDSTVSSDDVVVFRQVAGKRTVARFDLDAIQTGAAADPSLRAGDVVVANTSQLKSNCRNTLSALSVARGLVPF